MNRRKRRGLCQALRRREYGKPAKQDRNYLLSLGEDITATSCYRNKKCDLPGNTRSTFLICFSPDRSRMASTHGDHTVRVSEFCTGRCTHTLTGHPRTPWCIEFHPSSNDLLASGCLGGQVRIWDLVGGGSEIFNPPDKAVIASLAFHPTDRVLLIATSNKLYLWRWEQPTPFACLTTASPEEKVRLVKFSPLGDRILTGITNTALRLSTNAAAAVQNDPTSMNRLLQSVSCTRLDSNQVAEYLLRPTSGSSASVGMHLQLGSSRQASVSSTGASGSNSPSGISSVSNLSRLSRDMTNSSSSFSVSRPTLERTSQAYSGQPQIHLGSSRSNLQSSFSVPTTANTCTGESTSERFPGTSQPSSFGISSTTSSSEPAPLSGHVETALDPVSEPVVHTTSSTSTSQPSSVSMPSTLLSSSEPAPRSGHVETALDPVSEPVVPSSVSMPSTLLSSSEPSEPCNVPLSHGTYEPPERHGPFLNLSSEPIVRNTPLNHEGASSSNTTNSMPYVASSYSSEVGPSSGNIALPPSGTTSQEMRESSVNIGNNRPDTTGVFAIFRARDGGSWNLDTSEVESDADFANTSVESQGGEVSDSMSFGRIPQNSDLESMTSASSDFGNVLLRTRTFSSELRPNMTSTHETVTISNQENNTEGRRDVGNDEMQPGDEAVRINATDESITGMGTVFNVSNNTPQANLSSETNLASNLSTSSADSSGTAIATATARTFRHVHTAVVVAEGSNGGPQLALRTAINRAIAGAFAGSGEGAVASNIINTTHHLQWWDFSKLRLPDLKQTEENIICHSCKIHNDASVDIASDASMLAAFVPSSFGFPDDGMLAIYSLQKDTLGQCLFNKKFGPNAISVSLSPLNRYVMVGLAARRLHWHLTSRQLVAHIFKLETDNTDHTPDTLKPIHCVTHDCEPDRRSHLSVNAAFWHPVVGCGLVYGTNRGHLCMCQIGPRNEEMFASVRRGSYS